MIHTRNLIAILLFFALLVLTAGCAGADTEHSLPEQSQTAESSRQVPTDTPVAALTGTWERTHTETDGSIEETPAGQVIIQITGMSEKDLRISYTDKEFPDNNFSEKALTILTDGDTMGFEDAAWIAQIDHTGRFGQTYALALVGDMMVLRSYFVLDGAPGVGYETFRAIE